MHDITHLYVQALKQKLGYKITGFEIEGCLITNKRIENAMCENCLWETNYVDMKQGKRIDFTACSVFIDYNMEFEIERNGICKLYESWNHT